MSIGEIERDLFDVIAKLEASLNRIIADRLLRRRRDGFLNRWSRLLGGFGVRFVNSFSPYPSCCPARASASGAPQKERGIRQVR